MSLPKDMVFGIAIHYGHKNDAVTLSNQIELFDQINCYESTSLVFPLYTHNS